MRRSDQRPDGRGGIGTSDLDTRKGEDGLNIELAVGPVTGSRLVRDYVRGEPGAHELFEASYGDAEAYERRAEALDRRFSGTARREVADLLRRSGAPPERLEAFVEKRGFLMSAGQQPGLFGGPLYSIYKGLSAIAAAEALERALERPVLPIFWIASEDHDWEEATSLHVLDSGNELHRLSLPLDEGNRQRPLFRVELDSTVEETLEGFLALHPDTEFTPPLQAALRQAFRAGATLPQGFRSLMESWLGPRGLVFVEAHDRDLKDRSVDLLLRELDRAEESEVDLRGRRRDLEDRGYPVQVPILEGGVNLFLEGPAGRERLYREGDGTFRLRHSRDRLTTREVRDRVGRDPTALSPNVLLRPVVENALFPVLAHIAGPGEIGYYAQLPPLFRRHGLGMPVILPRHSVTVLEGKVLKVLDKFGLDLDDLRKPHHELAGSLAREEIPEEVRRMLGELRGEVAKRVGGLSREVGEIDSTLKGPVDHVRGQVFHLLDDLEKKIVQSVKRENEVALAQVAKAQRHVFPDGRPQERTLNPVYYLARYGDDFLERVLDAFRGSAPTPFLEEGGR